MLLSTRKFKFMEIKELRFLKGLANDPVPMRDYWKLKDHEIPYRPGVYILIARLGVLFQYPRGKSPIFYIGKAESLNKRLNEHLKHSKEARRDRMDIKNKYWRRYEYAASFGGLYTFIHTWQGMTAKNLERKIICQFADYYRSFPVANSAGSWR